MMASMAMLDHLCLFPDELALSATTPLVDPKTLKPSQYREFFTTATNFYEVWHHPCPFQRTLWSASNQLELSHMEARRVWSLFKIAKIPSGRRPVKCKWIFDIKRDGRFKARLVACGYSQIGGVDFTQVFSPVVNDVTFRIMLLAKMIWKLASYLFDVETAFLLGELEEELYMDCPPGLECEEDDCVLLHKSIYGLVQAARQFNKFWNKLMKKLGFKTSPADPCLFAGEISVYGDFG